MKVCAVTVDSLDDIWQEKLDKIGSPDLLLFGFNGLGLVSYKKELSLETEYFQDIANLSKQISSVVICGCDTDTYGVFRHSAVIADNGKILGVSDMLYALDDSEYSPGGNLRVYQTSVGRLGVIIGEDLFFPDVINALSLCDAEVIICLFKSSENYMVKTVAKSQAFCNGVSIVVLSNEQFCYVDQSGKIKLSTCQNIVKTNVEIQKEYHLLSIRKRCLTNDKRENGI